MPWNFLIRFCQMLLSHRREKILSKTFLFQGEEAGLVVYKAIRWEGFRGFELEMSE